MADKVMKEMVSGVRKLVKLQ